MTDKERITISFNDENEHLLDEIDDLVEAELFSDRTEAITYALARRKQMKQTDYSTIFDAAVSVHYQASEEGKNSIKSNAEDFILEEFPDSRYARVLEQ